MNEPIPTTKILRHLTYQQVIDEINTNDNDVYVMAPYYDGDRSRYFKVDAKSKKALVERLKSDPDRHDIESFFYIDFDLDIILDPFSKP